MSKNPLKIDLEATVDEAHVECAACGGAMDLAGTSFVWWCVKCGAIALDSDIDKPVQPKLTSHVKPQRKASPTENLRDLLQHYEAGSLDNARRLAKTLSRQLGEKAGSVDFTKLGIVARDTLIRCALAHLDSTCAPRSRCDHCGDVTPTRNLKAKQIDSTDSGLFCPKCIARL